MLAPWVALAATVAAALPFSVPAAPAPDRTSVAAPTPKAEHTERAERLTVRVLARFPHDTEAFTQGLELHEGMLYEGTGQYGKSELRVVEPMTGEIRDQVALPDAVFGEGITVVDDRIWQLTWTDGFAFDRNKASLEEIRRVDYDGEGWGVCHDAPRDRLVMSDGSAELTIRDPESFQTRRSVAVTLDGEPLTRLNELECVGSKVWANVWTTDEIVRIDPATGEVEAVVDASGLLSESEAAEADVLNGIAKIPGSKMFLVTGKLWPWTFLVEFS